MATTRLSGRLDSSAISHRLCSAQRERTNERMKERRIEREWVDLANLFCFLLPVHYCYKKSQSIMQCEKKNHSKNERQESEKEREGKRNENHATCTSLIWLLALRTMAGNKCMEMFPLTAGVCVPVIRGLADPPAHY